MKKKKIHASHKQVSRKLFTNDFMVVPEHEHLVVFIDGVDVARVDTYEEAYNELKEHGINYIK